MPRCLGRQRCAAPHGCLIVRLGTASRTCGATMLKFLGFVLFGVALLCGSSTARAVVPAYVQPNLALFYSGCSSATKFSCTAQADTPLLFSYSITSVSGNSVSVQANPGGATTCTDTACSNIFLFFINPASPAYTVGSKDTINTGSVLAVAAGCSTSKLIC